MEFVTAANSVAVNCGALHRETCRAVMLLNAKGVIHFLDSELGSGRRVVTATRYRHLPFQTYQVAIGSGGFLSSVNKINKLSSLRIPKSTCEEIFRLRLFRGYP